jgi:hypothetical protein
MSRTPRARLVETTLPESIDHRARLYSLAAATAGVSMLALAQPAEDKVVTTTKNIPIPVCAFFAPCSLSIDLNGDGVNDFKFSLISYYASVDHSRALQVAALNGGGVIGTAAAPNGPYASALLRGARIGPSDHFLSGGKDMVEGTAYASHSGTLSRKVSGKWGGNHPNRFLGLKFKIKGVTHYGWIRVTVDLKNLMSATITEYGYETIANKNLDAGLTGAGSADAQIQEMPDRSVQPSLGMLALGADGLTLWRREEVLVP